MIPPPMEPPPHLDGDGDPPISLRLAAAVYFPLAALFAVLLGRNIALGLRFEDALIVLRYARNLVAGDGFVFNPGERVLGVTTPLHTLLSTLWIQAGPELAPALQNLAGVACLIAEGWLVLLLARRLGYPLAGFLAALLTLSNFNFNYLYLGMEAHLFAALVLLAFLLHLDGRETATGVVLGLAFLTRYDAALAAALIGTGLLAERKRFPVRLTAAFFAVAAPWLVFAQLYFGSILPNPLAAKKSYYAVSDYLSYVFFYYKEAFKKIVGLYLPVEFFKAGLSYLFLVPMLAAAVRLTRTDKRRLVLVIYPFLHLAVYTMIGASAWFSWHYYVLNPFGYLLAVVGTAEILRRLTAPLVRRRAVPTVATVLVALPLLVHLARGVSRPYELDPATRQLYEIGGWLREHYGEETSLLQPAIGVLGWTTGFRMIDHAGLVTPGLYFFDDQNRTPIAEVIERHAPDLILLSHRSLDHEEVLAWRYRQVRVFEGDWTYTLYERGP